MRCVVSCGSTSFSWLVFFFGALLWGSMIQKYRGRWMWQGSASVVFWNWEKITPVIPNWFQPSRCCCCLCYRGEYLGLGTLTSDKWSQVLEACDGLKLLSIYFAATPSGREKLGATLGNNVERTTKVDIMEQFLVVGEASVTIHSDLLQALKGEPLTGLGFQRRRL